MRAFGYFAPTSLAEAVAVLDREGPGGRLLAGGTDLLVQAKERGSVPPYVVSLRDVGELGEISVDDFRGLRIGARVPLVDVAQHQAILHAYQSIAEGASLVGSLQIQNRGTLGGNVCNASPSADTVPPLIAFEGICAVYGPVGARVVPLENFFVGPGRTCLVEGEVLVAIELPKVQARTGSSYLRYTPRQEMDIAVVGVATTVRLDFSGRCTHARIILGAVGPTPLRAVGAESCLIGHVLDDETVGTASQIAAEESRPISDQRGSASYRRHLVSVLAGRTIRTAYSRANA